MPYFIFQVSPQKILSFVEQYEEYRTARKHVRDIRQQQSGDSLDAVRMVYAENQSEAEHLIKARREEQPHEDNL